MYKKQIKCKTAFTLAEVLITLAIIGVVAALMLPTLFTNVNQKVYDAREQNIVQKVTQAMNQMKALGLLSQTYDSTEDFIDELTKHLKVTKVCKTNLENCWPTKTVTDASGAEFDVSTVKTSGNINKKEFDSNSVGLVLAEERI